MYRLDERNEHFRTTFLRLSRMALMRLASVSASFSQRCKGAKCKNPIISTCGCQSRAHTSSLARLLVKFAVGHSFAEVRERTVPTNPEIKARIETLTQELDSAISNSQPRARGNYWTSVILMIIAVGASVVGGVGGLSAKFGSQVTGVLALVPGAIALLASNIKWQDKSNWHYRRKNESLALRSRLLLQLPEEPTADNVAAVAKDRDIMEARMNKEWEEKFSLNFAVFATNKTGP
jgi:hypothetical protein